MFKWITFILLSCFSFSIFAYETISKEATIIEVVSSAEILVEAVGVYESQEKSRRKRKKDVKRYGKEHALENAKKAALYFLLYNGTDPLLADADSIDRFDSISDEVFSEDFINELVMYVDPKPSRVISLNDGEGIKVFNKIKINMAFLREMLEDNLVIYSHQELVEELGYPQIMVIPSPKDGKSSLDLLKSDKMNQHAAGVIESFLSAKRYEVIVPTQLESINDLTESIHILDKAKVDPVYQLALRIGSDIYLDYSVAATKGAYETDKVSVTLRAYETTTGRLLGTETGYSKSRVGEEFVSIEEAILGAMTNVVHRVMKYWEEDLYKGVQYKVIVNVVAANLSDDKLEDVQDDIFEGFENVSLLVKENVVTDKTFDVNLWCNHEDVKNSRELYKKIRQGFSEKQNELNVRQVNRNRKLLYLEIK
ncbi:hypothetical protein DID74_02500 [Candidatus Marinamargulisbacteria bacterium SCGC AG-333-B06]|nr:hypothetical protein DID74_02500 [Candidatus Marinamargulisbacteria bacterium SCGC AG-333-B06]